MPLRDDRNSGHDDEGQASQPHSGGTPPIINAPAITLILAGLVFAAQVVRMTSPDGWQTLLNFTVVASGAVGLGLGDRPLGDIGPLLLHPFVHTGWVGAAMTIAAFLSFGGMAARPFGDTVIGGLQFLGYFFVCTAIGAMAEILVAGEPGTMMLGDWTAVSGCIAGAGWAMGGRDGFIRFSAPWGAIQLAFLVLSFTGFVEGSVGGIVSLAVGGLIYPLALRLRLLA